MKKEIKHQEILDLISRYFECKDKLRKRKRGDDYNSFGVALEKYKKAESDLRDLVRG